MTRVLLIEPNKQLRNFIAGILADFGHHVQACRHLSDGRDWLTRAAFDVVATDLVLDDAGRQPPGLAGLRVLTLSGHPFIATDDKCDRPARLHEKPFRFDDLRGLVAAVAELAPAQLLAA